MDIISHRGFWLDPSEKNSMLAFCRSFESGFGIETDIRDYKGKIVISHDLPTGKEIYFTDLLDKYLSYKNPNLTLALNIKADGLQSLLKKTLLEYEINNYFIFDCSVPDLLGYTNLALNSYTRQSDIEVSPSLYDRCQGIWLDAFVSDWYKEDTIKTHLINGKKVCIVSPELHNRNPERLWNIAKNISPTRGFALCTDFPKRAFEFFRNEIKSNKKKVKG